MRKLGYFLAGVALCVAFHYVAEESAGSKSPSIPWDQQIAAITKVPEKVKIPGSANTLRSSPGKTLDDSTASSMHSASNSAANSALNSSGAIPLVPPPASLEQVPQEILTQIEPLIRLNKAVKENPQLEPQALKYYEQCATSENLINSLRARCLNHLLQLSKKRGETVDLSRYSARLLRLSQFIDL